MDYTELTEEEQAAILAERKKRYEEQYFIDVTSKAEYEYILLTEPAGEYRDRIQSYLDGCNARIHECQRALEAIAQG